MGNSCSSSRTNTRKVSFHPESFLADFKDTYADSLNKIFNEGLCLLFEAERYRLVMNDALRYLIITGGAQEAGDNVLIEVISAFMWALVAKNIVSKAETNVKISGRPPYIITKVDESKMKTDKGPDLKELKTFHSKLEAYSRLISTERAEIKSLISRIDEFLKVAERKVLKAQEELKACKVDPSLIPGALENVIQNYQTLVTRRHNIQKFLDKLGDEALYMQSQISKLGYASEIAEEVAKKVLEEGATSIAEVRYLFKPELDQVLHIYVE